MYGLKNPRTFQDLFLQSYSTNQKIQLPLGLWITTYLSLYTLDSIISNLEGRKLILSYLQHVQTRPHNYVLKLSTCNFRIFTLKSKNFISLTIGGSSCRKRNESEVHWFLAILLKNQNIKLSKYFLHLVKFSSRRSRTIWPDFLYTIYLN